MKRKLLNKRLTALIAVILCTIIAITGTSSTTTFAASSKVPLKIGFKGKTVTFSDDILTEKAEKPDAKMLKSLKKKWGKPKVEKGEGWTTYRWKKGKTEISYTDDPTWNVSTMYVNSEDKNASICGIKVGMKAKKAKAVIKKLGGTVNEDGTGASVQILDTLTESISYSFKNGKVTSIYCGIHMENN